MKTPGKKGKKRQKTEADQKSQSKAKGETTSLDDEEHSRVKVEKKREKRERQKAAKQRNRGKRDKKKQKKRQATQEAKEQQSSRPSTGQTIRQDHHEDDEAETSTEEREGGAGSKDQISQPETDRVEVEGVAQPLEPPSESSASSSPVPKSPVFDNSTHHSSASSSSSIVPPSNNDVQDHTSQRPSTTEAPAEQIPTLQTKPESTESTTLPQPSKIANETRKTSDHEPEQEHEQTAPQTSPPSKAPKLPEIDQSVLKARLEARIAALRAARKADGPEGKPARSRQELIEARRRKNEARKAHKKEVRNKERVQRDAEEEAKRLRGGSGSPLWQQGAWDEAPEVKKGGESFSYGTVAFSDGAHMDSLSGGLKDQKKKKGPSDPKTALIAAEKKAAKLSGYDESKRAEVEEKDRWLNAKKRVMGEKHKDDANLLKKTLKRKEKQKDKSEREWSDRTEAVKKGKEAKQKKREENLRKRRDEKGVKKGKKGKVKGKGKPAVKRRPGFEGTFRSGKAPRL